MKAEVERPRTPLQTNMIFSLDRALNGAFAIQQVLDERKIEKFTLNDDANHTVFVADRKMQAMLAGGAMGAYNELTRPLRAGKPTTNKTMKALADGIIRRAKSTVFDY